MKNCREIEDLLPLYEEGVLSGAEKRDVDEHLARCSNCQKELTYLKKASRLVEQLPPVEEPPWFQQKIMARVRTEAQKKRSVQKWFYPLRVKVPAQIMATLVIAVLAVYIYRSADEEVRRVLPGAPPPAVEILKDPGPAPQETPQAQKKSASVAEAPRENITRDQEPGRAGGLQPAHPEPGELKVKSGPVDQADARGARESAPGKDGASFAAGGGGDERDALRVDVYPSASTPHKMPEAAKGGVANEERKAESRLSADMPKEREDRRRATAPAVPQSMTASVGPPQASVSLRVLDPDAALADVEKILARFEGKIKSRQTLGRRLILQAEVSGAHWKDMVSKLKNLGPVEAVLQPRDLNRKMISAVIEIIPADERPGPSFSRPGR